MNDRRILYTIGHSTHALSEFIRILRTHEIQLLADIRGIPRSRRNPQFNKDTLPTELSRAEISYVHMEVLGGRRKSADIGEVNAGWEHPSFRNYADYALGAEFRSGFEKLKEMAADRATAIMCAEAMPWRCHRRIVADWMVLVEGWQVLDILTAETAKEHAVTPFARMQGGVVTYPLTDAAAS